MCNSKDICSRLLATVSLSAASALVACSGLQVRNDFDEKAVFSRYRTYEWKAPAENPSDPLYRNALLERRIRNAVETELATKGLSPSGTTQPDFFVVCQIRTQQRIQSSLIGVGVGIGYGPFAGYGGPGFSIQEYTEGTLIIDFVDAMKKELFWRGYALGAVTSPEATHSILEKYPPK